MSERPATGPGSSSRARTRAPAPARPSARPATPCTRRRRALRECALDWLPVAALASLPILLERVQGLVHAGFDLGTFHIPHATWWWSRPRWLGGWNPWVFAGYPSNADPQIAGIHPFDALALVLSGPDAFAVEAALAPALAGVGMTLYLRGQGTGRAGRQLAALAFALGGFVGAHAMHPGLLRAAMPVPWALAAIDAWSGRRLLVATAAATAAILAAGHPQASLYALALVGIYALVCGRPLQHGRGRRLLGGLAAGVGLAAPLWLPLAELAARSTRTVSVPTYPDLRLGIFDLYRLFVPFAGWTSDGPPDATPLARTSCGFVECAAYPGMAVWLLVLCLLPALWRDRRGRFWLAAAAVGLAGAGGLLDPVLGLPTLRGPARLLLWWSVAVSALGGLACAGWIDQPPRSSARAWCAVAAGLGGVVAWIAIAHPDARRAAFIAALALQLATLAGLGPRTAPLRGRLLVAALALDLLLFRLALPDVGVPPKDLARLREGLAPVEAGMRAARADPHDRALVVPVAPAGNHAAAARVHLVQGYNPLVLRPLAQLLGMEAGADAFGHVDDPSLVEPTSHVLDLLRVRLVTVWETNALARAIAQRAADPDARFERVGPEAHPGFSHYRNRRAAPVAWIVPRLRLVAPGSAISILRGEAGAAAFDPRAEALVEAEPAAVPGDEVCWQRSVVGSARAPVSDYEDDRIRLEIETPCAGILVTSELAYPGWTATIDGRAGELLVVNGAFRGLAVPRGDHEVELCYRPRLPWLARLVCLATLLALLASARATRRPAIHRSAATTAPPGASAGGARGEC